MQVLIASIQGKRQAIGDSPTLKSVLCAHERRSGELFQFDPVIVSRGWRIHLKPGTCFTSFSLSLSVNKVSGAFSRLPNQEGSLPVRPGSLWRGESAGSKPRSGNVV